MINDFKSFGKIENINKFEFSITQKLHGTNAQIHIWKQNGLYQIKAACRTRYLTEQDDNYGFCKFVLANEDAIVNALGEGRHYGEWCGPGINSGEGLKEKGLYLFNWARWSDKNLPPRFYTVPLLYEGRELNLESINLIMDNLKANGSKLVSGYMHPEGIVINIGGVFYKQVFNPEETKWTKRKEKKPREPGIDVSDYMQPLRLEKLLSRDEKYIREFPESLPRICRDYCSDLFAEVVIDGDDDQVALIKKSIGRRVFHFVKANIVRN